MHVGILMNGVLLLCVELHLDNYTSLGNYCVSFTKERGQGFQGASSVVYQSHKPTGGVGHSGDDS